MLADWTLAPVVAALQPMRGMALVNAASLVAELGDLSQFANPRQLMAYLGLVPSEHSSGTSIKRGGLTKADNGTERPQARRIASLSRLVSLLSEPYAQRLDNLCRPFELAESPGAMFNCALWPYWPPREKA
jgi:transposase